MKNFVQNGNALDVVAPSGGVVSGVGFLVGYLFLVAASDAAEDEKVAGYRTGVFDLDAATGGGQDGSAGDVMFWNNSTKVVTKTSTGNRPVGILVEDKATSDAVARVVLIPRISEAAAAVAALTENGGAIGGTNDGDLPTLTTSVDLSGWNGSAATTSAQATAINAALANHAAALREIAAKVNAVIAA